MKKFFLFLFAITTVFLAKAQEENAFSVLNERGEIHFVFSEENPSKRNALSTIISIDKIDRNGKVYAYANQKEFLQFLQQGYAYEIISPKKSIATKSDSTSMAFTVEDMQDWDKYPTYDVYLQLMESFQSQYPDLCSIDTIGYSVNQRLILTAKISVKNNQPKPEFFYSSTMHGDEVTGFVLMLRLIEHLLSNYGEDEKITQLINSVDIYINPNANPDGTYFLSDYTVFGAKRYNANNEDLNRNYPNPFHQKNTSLEPENEAMINYVKKHLFTLSANIHGGAEVLNFPWDSYLSSERRPVDSTWWTALSRQFVDTCRNYNPHSFSDITPSGITYGGDWYKITGGRQDYMNAALLVRELTMEISSEKILPSNQLPDYWEFQHRSFLNYIEQAAFGIHGEITDSLTNVPLQAKVFIENHDDDKSIIYSLSSNGHFYRPIGAGKYDITFSATGYIPKTVRNISIEDFSSVFLTIKLFKGGKDFVVFPNPATDNICIEHTEAFASVLVYNSAGQQLKNIKGINQQVYNLDISSFNAGVYILKIQTKNDARFRLFVKQNTQ